MTVDIRLDELELHPHYLPQNVNFALEPNQHTSYCCLYTVESETKSAKQKDQSHSSPFQWRGENASTERADVEQSVWTFLTAALFDSVARHASRRLLSIWPVGSGHQQPEIAGVDYGLLTKRYADLPVPLNETELAVQSWELASLEIVGRYDQSRSILEYTVGHHGELHLTSSSAYGGEVEQSQSQWNPVAHRSFSKEISADVISISPSKMADFIVYTHENNERWLASFTEQLHKRLPAASMAKVLGVWNLTGQEAATGFGVSWQTLERWLRDGVPSDVAEPVADLSAATDLLVHYLKADRIPSVVRRPIKRLDGKSLMDLFSEGEMRSILKACRAMFQFENVHG